MLKIHTPLTVLRIQCTAQSPGPAPRPGDRRHFDLLLHGFVMIAKRAKRIGLADRHTRNPLLKLGERQDSGKTAAPQ